MSKFSLFLAALLIVFSGGALAPAAAFQVSADTVIQYEPTMAFEQDLVIRVRSNNISRGLDVIDVKVFIDEVIPGQSYREVNGRNAVVSAPDTYQVVRLNAIPVKGFTRRLSSGSSSGSPTCVTGNCFTVAADRSSFRLDFTIPKERIWPSTDIDAYVARVEVHLRNDRGQSRKVEELAFALGFWPFGVFAPVYLTGDPAQRIDLVFAGDSAQPRVDGRIPAPRELAQGTGTLDRRSISRDSSGVLQTAACLDLPNNDRGSVTCLINQGVSCQ